MIDGEHHEEPMHMQYVKFLIKFILIYYLIFLGIPLKKFCFKQSTDNIR